MEKKYVRLTLYICILLFVAVLLISILFSDDLWPGEHQTTADVILINEIMASNRTYPNDEGKYLDYIELYNPTDKPVDISQYKLSDNESNVGYIVPQDTVMEPHGYLVCWCDSTAGSSAYASFQISKDGGETIYLYNSSNTLIDERAVPAMGANVPYVRDEEGNWAAGEKGSPGFENSDFGYEWWLKSMGILPVDVVISEVQTANRSYLLSANGQLCDWIELYNGGSSSAVLDGYYLSDDPNDPMKWQIPELTLSPGGYAVIRCVGDTAGEGEADFALPRSGCPVILSGPVGNFVCQTEVPPLDEDRSWQLAEDNTYIQTDMASPGYDNTQSGYQLFRQSQEVRGALAISEVMSANNRYLVQSDGNYYDWVELKNISDRSINLSEYALSDNCSNLQLFSLPDKTLEPGEMVVVICAGNSKLTGSSIFAPFSLDWEESWLYVTHKEEGLSDWIRIYDVPYQASVGRVDGENDIFYFSAPTPGEENGEGIACIATSPFVETPGGVYNDVSGVSVVLSGEGQIRYTLDGSLPNEDSQLYTGPFTLTKTATVRAACFDEDKLPSDVVTASYIINENHTMPVISISADPDAMFGYSGIYTQYTKNWEIPCNMILYEDGSSFNIDCGIKMHGHTGLQNPKKSFKINFRGCYGADMLGYPLYGEDAPQVYDSLCIRAGQDYLFAIFREELFTSLCQDMSDHVLTQRSKFCILYINGQYWGIYNLKEAFSEMYYAQNRGVSEESVEMVQAPVYVNTDVFRFMSYLQSHDMTKEENYAYACTVFNMDSLIDWMIIQGYSTNGDVQQNLRYFRSSENGNTYEMALYDLDWAFYYHLPFTDILSNDRMDWQHLRITKNLIKNPTFRKKFLERLSYHMENTLSTENVLARIDQLHDELAPEVPREKSRWGGSYSSWENYYVARLRNFIAEYDHMGDIVRRLQRYIGLTQAEINQYFRRWA